MNKELTPLRCLLVDDEFFALELMESFLNRFGGCHIVDKVRNPLTAFRLLEKEKVDIMFLDIQMPQLNGFVLLNNLDIKPVTVFTTAYSEFAAKAFDADAADYLVKPFAYERFSKAMDKAKKMLKEAPVLAGEILQIKADRKWINVACRDIIYIEGWKEYLRIHSAQQVYTTLMSFAKMEELLSPKDFVRIHKSFIVSVNKVSSLGADELKIGEIKLPIARSRREYVQEMLVRRD